MINRILFSSLFLCFCISNRAQNIGIGTITPVNTLDVKGTMVVGANFGGSVTAPANGMLVQGNVGIGTTAPTYRLDVLGAIGAPTIANFSTATVIGEIKVSNSSEAALLGVDPLGVYTGAAGNSDFRISLGGNTRLIVKAANGNVGIGISNPVTSLHIKGALAISGIFLSIYQPQVTIDPGNDSFIRIRNYAEPYTTISLANGSADGQLLTIIARSGGVRFLDSPANNTQLNSNFIMGIDDALQLIWDSVRSSWIELHRSVN
jgi:hypothetical protein